MLPEGWEDVHRLLLVQVGEVPDVLLAAPTVRALSSVLPGAAISVLTRESSAEAAAVLPGVDEIIATQAVWQWRPGDPPAVPERERGLAAALRARHFDAAIILPDGGRSPYPAAYICYLAGIPIRLGQSPEFGGGLLSPWIRSSAAGRDGDPGLALLAAAGLVRQPEAWGPQARHDASDAAAELFGKTVALLHPEKADAGDSRGR